MGENTGGAMACVWGVVIFVIVIVLVLALLMRKDGHHGGGYGDGYGYGGGHGCGPSNWQVEKQEIVDACKTRETVICSAEKTNAIEVAGFTALANKMDCTEIQNLRDANQEKSMKILQLENVVYNDKKFGEVYKELDRIQCKMLKQPELFGFCGACPPTVVAPRREFEERCGCH